jgi:hypothetical protein
MVKIILLVVIYFATSINQGIAQDKAIIYLVFDATANNQKRTVISIRQPGTGQLIGKRIEYRFGLKDPDIVKVDSITGRLSIKGRTDKAKYGEIIFTHTEIYDPAKYDSLYHSKHFSMLRMLKQLLDEEKRANPSSSGIGEIEKMIRVFDQLVKRTTADKVEWSNVLFSAPCIVKLSCITDISRFWELTKSKTVYLIDRDDISANNVLRREVIISENRSID